MECSFQEVKNVFDTLPIGFYLGSGDINVSLDEKKADTSFFDAERNQIVISYLAIKQFLTKVEDFDMDLEQLVRVQLYHELSHVILTPKYLYNGCLGKDEKDRMNIFEDTRIEKIMRDYFMNVDFKKGIRVACQSMNLDFSNPNILKGMTGYWLCLRLGIGTKEMRIDFNEILKKYWGMSNYASNYVSAYGYYNKSGRYVEFREITNDLNYFYEKYFSSKAPPMSQEQQQQMLQQLQSMMNGENGENTKIPQRQGNEQQPQQENESNEGQPDKNDGGMPSPTKEEMRQNIQSLVNQAVDGKLIEKLRRIFERTSIVEKMTSGATNGYSGIFNPRAVVRDDYKFFMHQDNKGDSKGFSKLHLNLFIDVSGSFHTNQKVTNNLLNCLTRIEKDNPNFSYDLITIADRAELRPQGDKHIQCGGGNQIPLYLKDLYHKAYKYDAVNYNLFLFDGDCFSDTRYSDRPQQMQSFLNTFDTKLTTIISDNWNNRYFDKFKTARVIYSQNYVDELIDKVVEVLKVAFM